MESTLEESFSIIYPQAGPGTLVLPQHFAMLQLVVAKLLFLLEGGSKSEMVLLW